MTKTVVNEKIAVSGGDCKSLTSSLEELRKWYSKKVVENPVENETSSLAEFGLFIGFFVTKAGLKGFLKEVFIDWWTEQSKGCVQTKSDSRSVETFLS